MATTVRAKSPATGVPVLRLRSPLGLALERYRIAKGLGINELARLAKVDAALLSRLERGHQVSAHAATLRKLAKALKLDADHLLRLREVSRRMPSTTADSALPAGDTSLVSEDLESAIERDPTIPRKRKKWLLECVALARK